MKQRSETTKAKHAHVESCQIPLECTLLSLGNVSFPCHSAYMLQPIFVHPGRCCNRVFEMHTVVHQVHQKMPLWTYIEQFVNTPSRVLQTEAKVCVEENICYCLDLFTSETCKKSPFSSRLCERSPKKFFADQQTVFKRGSQLTSSSKEYTKKRNTVLVCQPFPVKCTKLLLFKYSLAFVRCHWRGSLGPCDLDHATIARLAAAIRSLTSSIGRYRDFPVAGNSI